MEVNLRSTDERIINASFEILEKEGIKGATTKKIAKKAGVSEVTLFRKFKTKGKLIEKVKEHYYSNLLDKLDEIFEYESEISIEDYLTGCFEKVVNLTDQELNIIKVGFEEIREKPLENKLLLNLSERIISKLTEFFTLKVKQNEIRDINPDILALNVYSILFESIILWKIHGKPLKYSINKYTEDFLDIILNGIKSDKK